MNLPTKVLFLDIDGVLNSQKTCEAFGSPLKGGFPHGFDADNMALFDHAAIALIRKLCEKTDASIVLSSSWRIIHSVHDCANGLDLPIFDRTPSLTWPERVRGDEIAAWLTDHPEVTRYAIVDDDSDMLDWQKSRFVQTNFQEGLSFCNYEDLMCLLGVVETEVQP
jgi:hypothetical protein